jgi:hypothetical protein
VDLRCFVLVHPLQQHTHTRGINLASFPVHVHTGMLMPTSFTVRQRADNAKFISVPLLLPAGIGSTKARSRIFYYCRGSLVTLLDFDEGSKETNAMSLVVLTVYLDRLVKRIVY